MICELNAPARPRSPVTSRMPDRVRPPRAPAGSAGCGTSAGRLGGLARHLPDRAARRGAGASIRCSARRRRAAATISIARVIFWMFLTDAMRFLTSLLGGHQARGAASVCSALARPRSLVAARSPASAVRRAPRAPRRDLTRSDSPSSSGWPSSSRSGPKSSTNSRDRLAQRLLVLVGPVAARRSARAGPCLLGVQRWRSGRRGTRATRSALIRSR